MRESERILLFAGAIALVCCRGPADIDNDLLNDRVKACSAGFSSSTRAGLHAELTKASLEGKVGGDFSEDTKSMIFAELPEQDREKGYRDYIGCIQQNWNK